MNAYPYADWVEEHFEVRYRIGKEYRVFCDASGHRTNNDHLAINVENGFYFCFACHKKGKLGSSDDGELNDADLLQTKVKRRVKQMLNPEVEKKTPVDESVLIRYKSNHPYWKNERGLNQSTIELFELGYDFTKNAATIPMRTTSGQFLGVTRRFLDEVESGGRYKYPFGFKRAKNLFASWLHEVEDMRTVCVTEGAIDAMKLWQLGYPAVAIYGSAVSDTHVQILKEMGVEKVVLCFDNDKAGRLARETARGAWRRQDDSIQYKPETDMGPFFVLETIKFKKGDKKDIGELEDARVHELLANTIPYRLNFTINKKRRYNNTVKHSR